MANDRNGTQGAYRLTDFDVATAPAASNGNGGASPPGTTEPHLDADPLPDEPRTELGHAHRFAHVFGRHVRCVTTWNHTWLVWDGTRWASDHTGQVKRWMKAIARAVTADALTITDDARRNTVFREAKRLESSSAVNGALSLASTEAEVAVHHEQLDAQPRLLNALNGTLDLATGQLRPHDRDDLITRKCGAAWRPDATKAEVAAIGQPVDDPDTGLVTGFGRFLAQVQPEPEMRRYLARLLGHALEGRLVEHILPILWGPGANGKGTLLDVVQAALGDYAGPAAPGMLTARGWDSHPTEIADLCGLRLARLDETDEGRRLAEGTVKRLTGDRRHKARRMRENFWEFDITHTFVMLTNHEPIVSGTDEGIWRRIRLVPFPVVVPEHERDERLPERLLGEVDTVLAWLVDGYQQWATTGLDEPEQVVAATAHYRAASDAVGRFIEDCCYTQPTCRVQSSVLYAAWKRWCHTEGIEPGSNKSFTASVQNRGFNTTKSKGRMVWTGLGLITQSEEDRQ